MPLRYLFEGRQGKSNALNTGMAAARAAIIVFTDDDVEVDRGWLESGVRPLLERQDIDYTGGPVRPIWGAPPPAWLNPERKSRRHDCRQGPWRRRRSSSRMQHKTPLGVNMAVRRTLIERIGGFRPDLGRNGKALLGQEQAEFFYRSRAAGARGLYVPAMVLDHVVPALAAHAQLLPPLVVLERRVTRPRAPDSRLAPSLDSTSRHVPRILGVPRFVSGIFCETRRHGARMGSVRMPSDGPNTGSRSPTMPDTAGRSGGLWPQADRAPNL